MLRNKENSDHEGTVCVLAEEVVTSIESTEMKYPRSLDCADWIRGNNGRNIAQKTERKYGTTRKIELKKRGKLNSEGTGSPVARVFDNDHCSCGLM